MHEREKKNQTKKKRDVFKHEMTGEVESEELLRHCDPVCVREVMVVLNGGEVKLKAGDGEQQETKVRKIEAWARRESTTHCWSLGDREKGVHASTSAHTHKHHTCVIARTVCMLGHADWVLQVLFTHACIAPHYAMKKALMGCFKEPYLLFQHQKVHLEASVIFYLFPQLWPGYIMLSHSLSLILSPAASLSSSPLLSSPLHMQHWSVVH